jgi:O-antigen/teichoic acid export membrane protein
MHSYLSKREKNLVKHIVLNLLYKGGGVIITLLMVPLSIKYLGKENYGIWITLFSGVAMFSFFNFGLGHGLRNYLTQAIANNNLVKAKKYISVAYNAIFFIGIVLAIFFFWVFEYINWQAIFKVKKDYLDTFLILIKIVSMSFFIGMTLKLINILFFAYLKPSMAGLVDFIDKVVAIALLYTLFVFDQKSLLLYGSAIVGAQFIVLLLANIVLFSTKYKEIKPLFFYFDKNIASDIFGLGLGFFIIQIAAVILYATDNFIILQLFSPEHVTDYNIAHKYFGIFVMISSLALTPLWSEITHAKELGELKWIKKIINKSVIMVALFSLMVVLFYFISEYVYILWIGDEVTISKLLSFVMAIYVITAMFLQIFSMFLNGFGKIKLSMILSISSALINIPLSIFLAKYVGMGTVGVIMATLVSNIVALLPLSMQTYKIINNKAKGLWNE